MAEWVPITDPNDPRLSDTPLNDSDPFADLGSQDPFEDAVPKANVRIMAYGPVVGERHKAAMFGPNDNELQPYDVAASPNLGLKLGEWIEVNGQARRVADWSYIKPGVPTKDTIEIRDAKDQGRGTINRISLTPDEIQKRIAEYPQLVGEKTQASERKAVEAPEVKGDPFADLIPTAKAEVPVGADPFADLAAPPPRGFKDVEQGQPLPESPTPAPIELPDATRTPEPTPQRRAPAISAPTAPSPAITLSPVPQLPMQDIPTGGQPIPPPIEAPGALPTPQGDEDPNMIQKTARALGAYAGQMIPQSLEQAVQMGIIPTDWTNPRQLAGFIAPPVKFSMGIGEQALHRIQQIREAEQTPPFSQQSFDAGIGTALDLLGMMGLVGGVKVGMRKPTVTSRLPKVEVATAREVPVPEAFQPKVASKERPAPQLAEPLQFTVDMPTDTFGTEHTPIANFLMSGDGVMSKSTAKRNGLYAKNPALWENAPTLAHPTHGKLYPSKKVAIVDKNGAPTGKFRSVGAGGETPDNAAKALYRAGLISDEYVDTMWEALGKESRSARNTLEAQRGDAKAIGAAAKQKAEQTTAFNQAEQAAWKGGEPEIPVKDLQVGDTVEIGGEKFKVTDIDPDTFDVTLEDGRKFGVQTVSDQTVIYGEHEPKFDMGRAGRENKAQFDKAIEAAGTDETASIEMASPTHPNLRVLITPDAETGKWRATRVDDRGPVGHNIFDSREQAISDYTGGAIQSHAAYGRDFVVKEVRPPTPPTQPPVARPPPAAPTPPPVPQGSETVNPVRGSGKFVRSYRVDKELGDRMEGIGAARESGALRAETEARNLLDGLTPAQETDLGRYLVSRRLKTVNPDHPQIISDIESRRIESDPALTKALDYYKAKIKPDIEGWRKRAGLSEEAAAGKEPEFISLIPKTMELIPQVTTTGRFINPAMLPRTTQFARAAAGFAKEYAVNMRDILTESYGEVIRKARTREFYDAAVRKGVMNKATVRMPDGNFVKVAQFDDLPPVLQHDLTEATKANLAPVGLQKVGRIYQRAVTGAALTANPAELVNHMRRQLNLVAAKPPIGMGLLARLEALVPYFGPKLGAFKRTIMDNMSTPENQAILRDIYDAGGGSSRSFEELYGAHPKKPFAQALHKYTGLEWLQRKTQSLLFGIPKGYGIGGWDLRMRVQLEKIRRAAEGNVDPQRIREFANQIGQYGRHTSWAVSALRAINPYAATTLPMRLTELKTAIGSTGLKEKPLSARTLAHRGETIARGTGGTILALTTANYLLSGKWPWENDKGHEFDLNTGVESKDGKTVYVKLRAIAPELSRPVGTVSIPDLLRERTARHPQYLSAAATGPANQAASLFSGPGQNLLLTAATGKVPYFLKRPGEGPELMDVAMMKKGERGKSRGLRQLKAAVAGVNPFGELFGPHFEVEVEGGLQYLEELIPGVKPFGRIFSTSYEKKHGSGMAPPPPAIPPPPMR